MSKIYKLKNRMRQPLPLEYSGKSVSIGGGGFLEVTESEYEGAAIQRHIPERMKVVAVTDASLPKKEPVKEVETKVEKVNMDPVVHEMAPSSNVENDDDTQVVEKDGESLTSFYSEADNEKVEPAKKSKKRRRSGK